MTSYLLAGQVARALHVSTDRVRQLAREGRIREERIGHIRVFKASEVERVQLAREKTRGTADRS